MMKLFGITLLLATIVLAKPEAKPGVVVSAPLVSAPLVSAPVAYTAPLITAPVVTATSSQSFVRNYNGFAAVASPLVAAASAPLAYTAAGPIYSPYIANPAFPSPYIYSPYRNVAPVAIAASSPLKYSAAIL